MKLAEFLRLARTLVQHNVWFKNENEAEFTIDEMSKATVPQNFKFLTWQKNCHYLYSNETFKF